MEQRHPLLLLLPMFVESCAQFLLTSYDRHGSPQCVKARGGIPLGGFFEGSPIGSQLVLNSGDQGSTLNFIFTPIAASSTSRYRSTPGTDTTVVFSPPTNFRPWPSS